MRILRMKAIAEKTGLSRRSVYNLIDAGTFPPPIKLGPRAVGWLELEVEEWIVARMAARDQEAAA